MVTYPKDWKEVLIGDIYQIKRGQVLATSKISPIKNATNKYPVYSSQTLNNGLLGYFNQYLFSDGITWTTDGANAGTTKYREGKFYCTNVCGVLSSQVGYANICMAEIINIETPKYVSYVGNPKLMSNVVSKISIILPPLPEQRAIGSILSDFDEHIDNLTELIEKKKSIRDGALEDLVSGKTRIHGFDGEWNTIPFNEYFTLLPTNTYSREQLSDRGAIGNIHYGDVLTKYGCVLSQNDYIPRVIDTSKLNARQYLKKNDVIIADTAEDDTVGKAVQVGDVNMPLVSGLHTMACRPNYPTADGFLGYYINSNFYHDQILPYVTGIKVSSISKKSIGKTEIYIPVDVEEQQAIASVLAAMDEEIKSLEVEVAKIVQIREGAMDDLLTGRVRLKV
ncbi:restriction endonuclease subunit S [Aminipila sp.]|uniref:restriction endonuclease subunit S n=1 Tax=Aminipila sp. TaxID=2060095 RepID=UPI00289A797C|nr:restriction endonuclease subunit S [Aminipila sp.]